MTGIDPLSDALDKAMIAEMGQSGRDALWIELWKKYGITRDNLTTLEKMQNALHLIIGSRAKSLVKAAFENYFEKTKITTKEAA